MLLRQVRALSVVLLLLSGCSCSESVELVDDGGTSGDGALFDMDGWSVDGAVDFGPEVDSGFTGTGDTQCTNGLDDDGDGLVDGFDAECVGPLDNDESSFATGIPGDNRARFWQDCFFDGNTGGGNDGCRYRTECLLAEDDPAHLPSTDPNCEVTQRCLDSCRPATPNGCDCFGCCGVLVDDEVHHVYAGDGNCDLEDLSTCTECAPDDECVNNCGTCELCPGKTTLPPECETPAEDGGAPPPHCETGEEDCSTSGVCSEGYCSQGCCTLLI